MKILKRISCHAVPTTLVTILLGCAQVHNVQVGEPDQTHHRGERFEVMVAQRIRESQRPRTHRNVGQNPVGQCSRIGHSASNATGLMAAQGVSNAEIGRQRRRWRSRFFEAHDRLALAEEKGAIDKDLGCG